MVSTIENGERKLNAVAKKVGIMQIIELNETPLHLTSGESIIHFNYLENGVVVSKSVDFALKRNTPQMKRRSNIKKKICKFF